MGNLHCKWVRDRLPLMAGEELRGLDLRRVERHLIGCPKCRQYRVSLDQALDVLHAASAHSPTRPDTPSLWPDLARQIRQSRRPAQAPLFTWTRRFGLWPAFVLGLALVAAVVAVGSRRPAASPGNRVIADVSLPPEPAAPVAPAAPAEVIEASREPVSKPVGEPATASASAESVPASRLGYDLDHAMPMGVEGREGKQPTF
jgi:anti-sigma factor RsiW